MNDDQPHNSRKSLSRKLSISISTLKRYEKRGFLVSYRIGPRLIRYSAESLSDFLDRFLPPPAPETPPALEPKAAPMKPKAVKKPKQKPGKPDDSNGGPHQDS